MDNISGWLERLGLLNTPDGVRLSVLMGGEEEDNWDLYPEQDMIIVGTQDMLLSRALNRGYSMSRFSWPIHLGLLNNDCLWVLDEVQLMGPGLPTSLQMDAFRKMMGTFGDTQTIWMSATCEREWLSSADRGPPDKSGVLRLDCDYIEDGLRQRVRAEKVLLRSDFRLENLTKKGLEEYVERLAESILARHRSLNENAPSLTIVILNTVERAQRLYGRLRESLPSENALRSRREKIQEELESKEKWIRRKTDGGITRADERKLRELNEELEGINRTLSEGLIDLRLLHSRFRPIERDSQGDVLKQTPQEETFPKKGRIFISTQVVEAGTDVSARLMFTELAPWTSMVQRFGRLNRGGEYENGLAYWIDIRTDEAARDQNALPYSAEEMDASRSELTRLERGSPEILSEIKSPSPPKVYTVPRKKDILELFDTTPDLSGNDIDITAFIRDIDTEDARVFWRRWENTPSEDIVPDRRERCPVNLESLREFAEKRDAEKRDVWGWDHLEGRWEKVTRSDIFPGRDYLIHADHGGYSIETGWSPALTKPVEVMGTHEDRGKAMGPHAESMNTSTSSDYQTVIGKWQTLKEHTDQVVEIICSIVSKIPYLKDFEDVLILAARFHDLGKAHEIFQSALLQTVDRQDLPLGNGIWAKSGGDKRLRYQRRYFRHELASALGMIQHLESSGKRIDLPAYLVAAHHGKVRLSIRSLPDEEDPPKERGEGARFARGIWEGDTLPPADLGGGFRTSVIELKMDLMEMGSDTSAGPTWLDRVMGLREHPDIGPFRLAYLEGILRAADRKASAIAAGGAGHE